MGGGRSGGRAAVCGGDRVATMRCQVVICRPRPTVPNIFQAWREVTQRQVVLRAGTRSLELRQRHRLAAAVLRSWKHAMVAQLFHSHVVLRRSFRTLVVRPA